LYKVHLIITNPLRRVLVPRAGRKIVLHLLCDQPSQFSIYGATRSFGQRQPDFLAVDIRYDASSRLISLTPFGASMTRYFSAFNSK